MNIVALLTRHRQRSPESPSRRQFQAGTTTVFLVLQRQTELIASRTRQVRAEADLGEAKAGLDRALSRTIEVQSIQLK